MDCKAIPIDFVTEDYVASINPERFAVPLGLTLKSDDTLTIDDAGKPQQFGAIVSFAIEHASKAPDDASCVIEGQWTFTDRCALDSTNPLSLNPKAGTRVIARGLVVTTRSKLAHRTIPDAPPLGLRCIDVRLLVPNDVPRQAVAGRD